MGEDRLRGIDRVAVIGCSGAGKSWLAQRLAERLGLPFVSTEAAFWASDWTRAPEPELRAWLARTASGDRWVMDGNFDGLQALHLSRAQLIVWLDPGLGTVLGRLLRRNLWLWLSGRRLPGGRRMTLGWALAGLAHAARTWPAKRRRYPKLEAAFPSARLIRFRSPRALKAWLDTAAPAKRSPKRLRLAPPGALALGE